VPYERGKKYLKKEITKVKRGTVGSTRKDDQKLEQ
jgi:hypothetical protein